MKHRKTRTPTQDKIEAGFTATLERIAHDPALRRELQWIRAMERGDTRTSGRIERLDPDVPDRLEPLAMKILGCALPNNIEDPTVRREFYLKIFDERFRHHISQLLGEQCNCIGCSGIPLAEQNWDWLTELAPSGAPLN